MDSNGMFARSFDESLVRDLPHLRIAPLREPVSSRNFSLPLTLEPNASGVREPSTISKAGGPAGILPSRNEIGALVEGTNATRSKKNNLSSDSLLEPPPRPILPAFVNLRALERFPYSSFDDDNLQSRKRRRVDVQLESFGDHLHLPIPQSQKEQRPPPFGPFAILNGLNEPPPNAALLPPIEAGSITQLLTKPSRDSIVVEPALITTNSTPDAQIGDRVEGRIADILDSPIAETPDPNWSRLDNGKVVKPDIESQSVGLEEPQQPVEGVDKPLSPKARGRSRKNIRRWTDEETIDLLCGALKCGIGNWKEVLAQPGSNFNKRSSSNLKDRFRVCCPWAYQASDPNEAIRHLRGALAKALARVESRTAENRHYDPQPSSADSGLFLTNTPDLVQSGSSSSFSSIDTCQHRSDDHLCGPRSNASPLNEPGPSIESLGLSEPGSIAKSRRRSRRPFTTAEDESLLKGYAVHGFHWTLIQQDKRLNLGHRRATDLRDRFRTKFPDAYRDGGSISGGSLQAQMTKNAGLKDGTHSEHTGKQNLQESLRTFSGGRSGKPGNLNLSTSLSVDPLLPSLVLPPTGREGFIGVPHSGISFPLDESSANTPSVGLPPIPWVSFLSDKE